MLLFLFYTLKFYGKFYATKDEYFLSLTTLNKLFYKFFFTANLD